MIAYAVLTSFQKNSVMLEIANEIITVDNVQQQYAFRNKLFGSQVCVGNASLALDYK